KAEFAAEVGFEARIDIFQSQLARLRSLLQVGHRADEFQWGMPVDLRQRHRAGETPPISVKDEQAQAQTLQEQPWRGSAGEIIEQRIALALVAVVELIEEDLSIRRAHRAQDVQRQRQIGSPR